jgi:hypothetical protein
MTSTIPAVPTDVELVVVLETTRAAVATELAELEARRAALVARLSSLDATIAVYKGATPEPAPAPKRRASKRAPGEPTVREQRAAKKAAKEAEAAAKLAAVVDTPSAA